ncbi:MAG: hypothetical protein WDN76_12855 [Alphaproteobacteria bacterium]
MHAEATALMAKQQARWVKLREELREVGLSVVDPSELTKTDLEWLRPAFMERVFPLLTPLAVDPAHPFPFIPNLGFAIALRLKRIEDGLPLNALLPVPSHVERFIEIAPDMAAGAMRPRRFFTLEKHDHAIPRRIVS